MEEQAATLLATLRKSSVAVDAKLAQFNQLKSSIKHLRVPDAAQPTIFDCIKVAIGAQTSPTLVSTGLSTLGHLIKRLTLQEQGSVIASQCGKLLPVLQDRLGDARESHRAAASQCLSDLWIHSHGDVERLVLGMLAGSNARAKEMAMMWVSKVYWHTLTLSIEYSINHLLRCTRMRTFRSRNLSHTSWPASRTMMDLYAKQQRSP